MTRAERKRLKDRAQWIRNRGFGVNDELYIWLSEVLVDLIDRTARAETRILELENQPTRRQEHA